MKVKNCVRFLSLATGFNHFDTTVQILVILSVPKVQWRSTWRPMKMCLCILPGVLLYSVSSASSKYMLISEFDVKSTVSTTEFNLIYSERTRYKVDPCIHGTENVTVFRPAWHKFDQLKAKRLWVYITNAYVARK